MRHRKGIAITALILGIGMTLFRTTCASAADTATLRVISTTDLHNQVSSADYEEADIHRNSLARLSTMIKSAREEVADGGSITVDAGDSVYGYSAKYLYNKNTNIVQPIYVGMSKIGYDAITLGNHDFDFGFQYINKQLNLSGLSKICLVANVVKYSDGKRPWAATKMISRTLTTAQGKKVTVKIGIIGVTRTSLSTVYDCDGELVASGMIASVKANAAALKKSGADVVVVLAHAGIGDEKSTDAEKDVAYQLTKLSDVDCIMAGHPHRNFPSADNNVEGYYALPGVNRKTGLVNGKPLIYVADHASGIGIADLTLSINGSKVQVAGAKAAVRSSSVSIMPDPAIESVTDAYDAEIKKGYNAVVAKLPEGERITGYFTMTGGNYAYQLNNEAKIQYGMKYQMSREGKAYADYGVLSCSRAYMDGSDGAADYFDISGNITWGDLLNVQRYDHWNYIYWVSGAQLKEWLEWSASAYARSGEVITSDTELNRLSGKLNITGLLSNTWGSYTPFVHFDGVEYEFDITGAAKYDRAGNLLNGNANRVKKLTYNGKNVSDNMKFLVVCNTLSSSNPVLAPITGQRLDKNTELRTVERLRDYIKELGSFQDLSVSDDHNWSIRPNAGMRILRTSSLAASLAESMPWYQKTLSLNQNYGYFQIDFSKQEEDVYGPLLVLAPSTTEPTNENITIKVQATDASGIHVCKYLLGNHQIGDEAWKDAKTVIGGKVTASVNGTYSFLASDTWGNMSIRHISISNINAKKLTPPEVNIPTNKQTQITGYAKAGLTVRIAIAGKTHYSTTVKSNGNFSCNVGKHKAGTKVQVYVEDSQGRMSDTVTVRYDRTGPNSPSLNTVTNKTTKLQGNVGDNGVTIIAYVGAKDVYVPAQGGASIYKNSKKYDKKRHIIPTSYKCSGGSYSLEIPEQNAGMTVKVMAIDIKGRSSLVTTRTITKAAPNKPTVNTVCDAEKAVTGKIPSTNTTCRVTVKVGQKKYSAKSLKNGSFEVETKKLKSGMTLSVFASDTSDGKTRKSAETSCQVISRQNYVKNKNITVNKITSKTTQIKGSAAKGTTLYFNYGSSYTKLSLNKNGKFYYTLPKTLKAGQVVYFVNRKNDGSIIAVKQIKVKKAKKK